MTNANNIGDNANKTFSAYADLVIAGRTQMESGTAGIAAIMVADWDKPMFAVLNDGTDKRETFTFTLADMYIPRQKLDGTGVNGKVLPAFYLVLAETYSIVDRMKNPDVKQAIKRAWRIGAARQHLGIDVSFTPAGAAFPIHEVFPVYTVEPVREEVENEEGDMVEVMTEEKKLTEVGEKLVAKEVANAKRYTGADISEEQALDNVLASKVVVNGKADPVTDMITPPLSTFSNTFARILTDKGFDAFAPRATRTPAATPEAEFDAAVKAIGVAVTAVIAEGSDESPFAPTAERNAAIAALVTQLEAYLDATSYAAEDAAAKDAAAAAALAETDAAVAASVAAAKEVADAEAAAKEAKRVKAAAAKAERDERAEAARVKLNAATVVAFEVE